MDNKKTSGKLSSAKSVLAVEPIFCPDIGSFKGKTMWRKEHACKHQQGEHPKWTYVQM